MSEMQPSPPPGLASLVTLLAKSMRTYQIYEPNNPIYQRFSADLRAAFTELWTALPELHFTIEERALVWEGIPYRTGEGRDDLAFRFYKDGVRFLTFLPGFEDEIERFLDVVHRARNPAIEEDDLVTLLWEQDFDAFEYGYIDLLAEGIVVPERLDAPIETVSPGSVRHDAAEPSARWTEAGTTESDAGAAGTPTTGPEEPEPAAASDDTLYFLDSAELDRLQAELEEEWSRDLRTDVLNALFDRFEDPDPERQLEILGILRQLLAGSLARGEFSAAAMILREMEDALQREPRLDSDQREEIERLFEEVGEPAVLEQLVSALEDGSIDPDSRDLGLFFARLPATALRPLIRATARTGSESLRARLRQAVDTFAEYHTGELPILLADRDDDIAIGTAHIVTSLRMTGLAPRLAELLDRPAPEPRLAAVEALIALGTARAIEALGRALEDPVREVRLAAAKGLGELQSSSARPQIEAVLDRRGFRNADLTEKLAVLDAYARIAGDDAVPRLDRMLNARKLFRRRPPAELRACAAAALGRVASPEAREALEHSSKDADPVVRSAVARALRGEVPAS